MPHFPSDDPPMSKVSFFVCTLAIAVVLVGGCSVSSRHTRDITPEIEEGYSAIFEMAKAAPTRNYPVIFEQYAILRTAYIEIAEVLPQGIVNDLNATLAILAEWEIELANFKQFYAHYISEPLSTDGLQLAAGALGVAEEFELPEEVVKRSDTAKQSMIQEWEPFEARLTSAIAAMNEMRQSEGK